MSTRQRVEHCLIVVLCCVAVQACTAGSNPYSYGYYSGRPLPAAAASSNTARGGASADYHEVSKGETMYSISWEYGQDVRDVARWNQIGPPYTIYPKQRLRVSAPPVISSPHSETTTPNATTQEQNASTVIVRETAPTRQTETAKTATSPLKISWQWPTNGTIIGTYSKNDKGKKGLVIAGTQRQPIYAAAAGRVVYSGAGLRGYGNLVIIKHDEIYYSAYAHNDRIHVSEDQTVNKGQLIADMGSSGSDKVALHFEVRREGKPVDPLVYLPRR